MKYLIIPMENISTMELSSVADVTPSVYISTISPKGMQVVDVVDGEVIHSETCRVHALPTAALNPGS